MKKEKDLRLSCIFTQWYNTNKRDLPWRNTTDPYIIWLSEVILQQTRVDQGYTYFINFSTKYPTVKELADAEEDEILKLWQGLGYYSRARNLHQAAKDILKNHNGIFPADYKEILKLKGIGEYTAAAIASFAYNKPHAVVDGNVYRVLSRIFGIETPIDSTKGKKEFQELANELLDDKNPGLHNQAIMEFGALQCTPKLPKCDICPASNLCIALNQNKINQLPIKEGRTKVRKRYFNYFYIKQGEYTFIKKRTQQDIWKNLYEFPLIETENATGLEELLISKDFLQLFKNSSIKSIAPPVEYKHILSHQIIYAFFYRIEVENFVSLGTQMIKNEEINHYAVSKLTHRHLEKQTICTQI